jgi:hypothetical protein
MVTKVYSLKPGMNKVPTDILKKYIKLKKDLEFCNSMISMYTKEWVTLQKEIISYDDMFSKLAKEDLNGKRN